MNIAQRAVPRNLQLLKGLLEHEGRRPVPSDGQPLEVEADFVPKIPEEPRRPRWRYAMIATGFALVVALPTVATGLYMAFIAADQYHSAASFSVRSIDAAQSSDILGMFSQASSGTTVSDSYVLVDYILSERMVHEVEDALGMYSIFAPRGLDYFYGLGAGLPIEDKLDYWRRMVTIDFDHSSGIMNLQIKAFTPAESQRIADFVIMKSEALVNELSLSARNEVLSVSEGEVQTAEARLVGARTALRSFRDSSQEADPVEGAKLAAQLVGGLEQQLVQLNTELSTALNQMGEDTPRVRVMRSQIASLEKQISLEKQRFGSGVSAGKQSRSSASVSDVAGRLQQFETLETQREFAERAYTSALASLEKARIEASGKQRYLAVFIRPTLSELSQYPGRVLNTALIFLGCLFAWSIAVMVYYNIRDRN